ncbi:MAG: hypothetical protein AAFR96_09250 [Planctomycetota bacterium]
MTSQRIWACFVLAVAAAGAPAIAASAQLSTSVERLEAYKAVVAGDRAIVRCGPGAAYYPVSGELKPGAILDVDGQTSAGWLRVRYPSSAAALVRADHVDVQADTQTARLNRDDALLAFNASNGARGSWSKLLAEPLPAGTELRVIGEAVNELTGELAGYQVEPPADARGFIRADAVRRATSAELDQAAGVAAAGGQADAPGDRPADGTESDSDPIVDAEPMTDDNRSSSEPAGGLVPVAEDTARDNPAEDGMAGDGTDRDGMPALDVEGSSAPPPMTAADEALMMGDTAAGGEEPDAETTPPPAPVVIQSLEDLEAAFAEVQEQPISEAEFDQLLAEVGRMIAATDRTPANMGLIDAMESRQTVLRLRQRIQRVYRENQAAANAASDAAMQTEQAVARIKQDLGFTAIGRLLPSAVYDGQRLPRMYRVQALDTTEAPRTLGYLRPDPAFGFEAKLNQTVGVVGALRNDARMNLQIIEPIRVEVIQLDVE